jgi:ABC-type antimicrobial peptide transport system permease subunit
MEQILDDDTAGGGAFVSVLGVFGGMALLLAAGGILGVASRAAAYRRQEVGIRLALGAGRGQVYRLMVGRGLMAAGVGALLGIAAAFGVSQLMADVLFGVSPIDPLTYATVLAILGATALAASVGPAIRSLRRDPLRSLRYE